MDFYKDICSIVGDEQILTNEPMSRHTTFRIGGPADYFIMPGTAEELAQVIRLCREADMPFYIMGNGSNLLVGDKGYRGAVIQIFKRMNEVRVQDNCIYAQAGALLSKIAAEALKAGLGGFEFASGIPGTLGGALMMNAGAYGGEMKQVLKSAEVLDMEGNVFSLPVEEMELGYRTSIFSKRGYIVLGAEIVLQPGNPQEIRDKMEDLKERRVTKQPLEYGSAGSTFKRPEGYFAGKLIQEAGLQGFRVGDAQVSEKHCGFVINRGNATAAEVVRLMNEVTDRVEKNSGVRLEPEVKRIGEF